VNLLRLLFRREKPQSPKPLRILTDAEGLCIFRQAGDGEEVSQSLRWGDVALVTAYRKDCYGFDVCCVEILSKSSGSILLQEQNEGFVDACFAITHCLAVLNADWFLAMQCRPAFDTTIDLIYKRPNPDEEATTQASS
jgi:hypothetical protein